MSIVFNREALEKSVSDLKGKHPAIDLLRVALKQAEVHRNYVSTDHGLLFNVVKEFAEIEIQYEQALSKAYDYLKAAETNANLEKPYTNDIIAGNKLLKQSIKLGERLKTLGKVIRRETQWSLED